eukprot:Filipodium_phascolosomae@DN5941_c0_g1_i1.p1
MAGEVPRHVVVPSIRAANIAPSAAAFSASADESRPRPLSMDSLQPKLLLQTRRAGNGIGISNCRRPEDCTVDTIVEVDEESNLSSDASKCLSVLPFVRFPPPIDSQEAANDKQSPWRILVPTNYP